MSAFVAALLVAVGGANRADELIRKRSSLIVSHRLMLAGTWYLARYTAAHGNYHVRECHMSGRFLAGCLLLIMVGSLTPTPANGQAKSSATRTGRWTQPMTPWGDPDLQGIWNNVTATPLQRSDEFKDKASLTTEEAAEYARRITERQAENEAKPIEAAVGRGAHRLLDDCLVRNEQPALGQPHLPADVSGEWPPAAADAGGREDRAAAGRA